MYLKDYDNPLFSTVVRCKRMLNYFVDLLYGQKNNQDALQVICNEAKARFPMLEIPLEAIAEEISSTLTSYYEAYIEPTELDIDICKYRSIPEAIQFEILPTLEDEEKRTFVVALLNGKIVK